MEKSDWYVEPEWLLQDENWPVQPEVQSSSSEVCEKRKPVKEIVSFVVERHRDALKQLLERKPYWTTLLVTAYLLRFVQNCRAKLGHGEKQVGPLITEKISSAQDH